jgi:hypothetical protein
MVTEHLSVEAKLPSLGGWGLMAGQAVQRMLVFVTPRQGIVVNLGGWSPV